MAPFLFGVLVVFFLRRYGRVLAVALVATLGVALVSEALRSLSEPYSALLAVVLVLLALRLARHDIAFLAGCVRTSSLVLLTAPLGYVIGVLAAIAAIHELMSGSPVLATVAVICALHGRWLMTAPGRPGALGMLLRPWRDETPLGARKDPGTLLEVLALLGLAAVSAVAGVLALRAGVWWLAILGGGGVAFSFLRLSAVVERRRHERALADQLEERWEQVSTYGPFPW